MTKRVVVTGKLCWITNYEGHESVAILVSGTGDKEKDNHVFRLSEYLPEQIPNEWQYPEAKIIVMSYALSNIELTDKNFADYFLQKFYGQLEADYYLKYSEITGYLWTHETLEINHHNLLSIFEEHVGENLYVEFATQSDFPAVTKTIKDGYESG